MDYWGTKKRQIIAFVVCIAAINKVVYAVFVCDGMGYIPDNKDRSCRRFYFCDVGDVNQEVSVQTCVVGERFNSASSACTAKDTVICPTDGPVSDNFYVRVYQNMDQRFNGTTIGDILHTKSKIECSAHCLSTINCKGFNYKYIKSAQGHECELLKDKSTSIGDLTQSTGYVHYEV
ncbi:unnamed protein product [Owenia fusiformis]|uniref:Uncharacterized protein n=1 Tax=Owenia fusiformis TaxID=6347 RepID=A0A8J1TWL0_OWEFU|nr:unnamed protein product [Owenia fusiformis]